MKLRVLLEMNLQVRCFLDFNPLTKGDLLKNSKGCFNTDHTGSSWTGFRVRKTKIKRKANTYRIQGVASPLLNLIGKKFSNLNFNLICNCLFLTVFDITFHDGFFGAFFSIFSEQNFCTFLV